MLEEKLTKAIGALSRILPNLEGPNASCRELYSGVIRSTAMYGAPVWYRALQEETSMILRRPQRAVAIRIIRGYRTVSTDAACALAGTIPWDLEAKIVSTLYDWKHARVEQPTPKMIEEQPMALRRSAIDEWSRRLVQPKYGINTINAIQPILRKWVDRENGELTFRMTQVITGHGCLGWYLNKIAMREPTSACYQCNGCEKETAQHLLEECPLWNKERDTLKSTIGDNLTLPNIMSQIISEEEKWKAFQIFCETVMAKKEEDERRRETETNDAIRRRRNARRKRRSVHSQLGE
ncbi:uncharacterized protein LOC112494668 [Cephus cinctus]|uniref:Uncharacterized protein LOC112494668 n=1 Tax=Cephus cinctus TaxID=211228 RepID=A0AAJ7RMC8_CEPCN|nr:uncharacterized protein LOC112494668 [Cephus cinctus]